MPGPTDDLTTAAWQTYAAHAATTDPAGPGQLPDRLEWAPVPGLGPGEEILGDLAGTVMTELGCGTGDTTAFLASRGARVTGIDAAPTQIYRARTRWGHLPGAGFACADARDHLAGPGPRVDAVISVFGALDFTPPGPLLPLIAARLRSGGLLAFSTLHPAQARHLPTDRLTLDSGARVPIRRPLTDPAWWPAALTAAGLAVQTFQTFQAITHPAETDPRCLIVVARRC